MRSNVRVANAGRRMRALCEMKNCCDIIRILYYAIDISVCATHQHNAEIAGSGSTPAIAEKR